MTRRHVLKGFVFTPLLHLLFKKLSLAAQGKYDAPFLPEVAGASLVQLLTPACTQASCPCRNGVHHSFLAVSWEGAVGTTGQTSAVTTALLQTLLRGHAKPAVTSQRRCTRAADLPKDHASAQGLYHGDGSIRKVAQSLCVGFFDITGGLLAQGHLCFPSHTSSFLVHFTLQGPSISEGIYFPCICDVEQRALSQSWISL